MTDILYFVFGIALGCFLQGFFGAWWKLKINQAVTAERHRCYDFLMSLHANANGKHNYYHVAANQLMEEK